MDIQPQVTSRYVDLFRHREFRALWTGSALGVAAGTVASLSLGTLIYAQTGSPLLAAAAMFGPSLVQLAGAGTLMSAADTAATATRPERGVRRHDDRARAAGRPAARSVGPAARRPRRGVRHVDRQRRALGPPGGGAAAGPVRARTFGDEHLGRRDAGARLRGRRFAAPPALRGAGALGRRGTGRRGCPDHLDRRQRPPRSAHRTGRAPRDLARQPRPVDAPVHPAPPARVDDPQRADRRVRGAVRPVRRRRGRGPLRRRRGRHAPRRRDGRPGPLRTAATGIGDVAALVAGRAVPVLRPAPRHSRWRPSWPAAPASGTRPRSRSRKCSSS